MWLYCNTHRISERFFTPEDWKYMKWGENYNTKLWSSVFFKLDAALVDVVECRYELCCTCNRDVTQSWRPPAHHISKQDIQGAFSYTLMLMKQSTHQFRAPSSALCCKQISSAAVWGKSRDWREVQKYWSLLFHDVLFVHVESRGGQRRE